MVVGFAVVLTVSNTSPTFLSVDLGLNSLFSISMSNLDSPIKLWELWFLKLSTKKPDLNLSSPVFGSLTDKFLVSVSNNDNVV